MMPGVTVTARSGAVLTRKTKAPSRFTEAALVRELEKRGIGRPSTFAAILENIHARGYVTEEKRFLVPTPLGEKVMDALTGVFSFMEYAFTRDMEQALDDIAEGKGRYKDLVAVAFARLSEELTGFNAAHALICPECRGTQLRHLLKPAAKNVRGYDFFACPDCKATFANIDGKPGPRQERHKPELSEYKCGYCGKPLIRRTGTGKNGKPYDFFGCSGYPECKATYAIQNDKPVKKA